MSRWLRGAARAPFWREVLLAWFEWLFARYVTDEDRAADLRARLDGAL